MDFQAIITMPEPIGYYTSGPTEYRTIIYATRNCFLPMVGKETHQVQIAGFGGLYWINIPENEVTLTKETKA